SAGCWGRYTAVTIRLRPPPSKGWVAPSSRGGEIMLRALSLTALLLAPGAYATGLAAVPSKPSPARPRVEVVFCLDTTGSMGRLIDGAKAKIWSICNQIAGAKPTPDLKVGLVAYRDRGDEYITKVFDLSDDLDAIHGHLKSFQARGGGDTPASL